jgi:hypothetical protein
MGKAMEQGARLMKPAPPKLMEAMLGLLIPPACRQEVLGDLHERYMSARQYIVDAVRIVPLVIASRLRRTTDPQVFLMQAFAVYFSFLGAAWQLRGTSFLNEHSGFLRLTIPTAAAMLALMLADAYANPQKRWLLKPIVDAAFGVASAFLTQAVLSLARGELVVPAAIMIFGGGMGMLLVSALRLIFPSAANRPQEALSNARLSDGKDQIAEEFKMSLIEIRQKSQKFEKQVRWSNVQLLAGIMVVSSIVFLGRKVMTDQPATGRVVGGVAIVAALYVIYQLYRRGSARAVPPDANLQTSIELYRAQLERRRKALRGIWSWYAGPILVALTAFGLQAPLANLDQPGLWWKVAPFVVLSIFWSVMMAHQSRRAANDLQREIDSLSPWDKEPRL